MTQQSGRFPRRRQPFSRVLSLACHLSAEGGAEHVARTPVPGVRGSSLGKAADLTSGGLRSLLTRRTYKCMLHRWRSSGTAPRLGKTSRSTVCVLRMKTYDFSKGKRGPVLPVPPGKERITIRLDTDILEYFRDTVERAGGGNYQTLINSALRAYIEGAQKPTIEETLRRVIRKELRTAP